MNTNYGIIEGGKITAPLTMRSNFNGVGAWHTLTDEERAAYGWYPADVINESYDPRSQIRSIDPVNTFDGERIRAEYTITDKPLETIQSEDLDRLADIRYQQEISGVTSGDGISQSSRRLDRLLLADKISFMEANPSVKTTNWKAENGRFQVDVDQLKELQSLVGFHVDQTYKAENAVAEMIQDAKSVEDLLAINVADEFQIAFTGS